MEQLAKYIVAMTNLYGMVHKDKVVEIYNSQNEEQITVKDVEKYTVEPLIDKISEYFAEFYKDHFVNEAIMEFGEFDIMLMKKADKPYYVPDKNELLKYADQLYFEKNEQYNKLVDHVKDNFLDGDLVEAERICGDLHLYCELGVDIQLILHEFERRNIEFKSFDQTNELIQLVMDLANNTRIWENNGYTPKEIFEKFEKPHLKPLPDEPYLYDEPNTANTKKRQKVGRNDPCPCGSGKKYKKCCLNKFET